MRMPTDEQVPRDAPECDVVLTRDHEYYVLNGICIAVRERSSGRYLREDRSIGTADKMRSLPRIGEWLCLERAGVLHYEGPVLGRERRAMPSPRIVSGVLRRARLV